jgi:parallel beta-helix repeat protein
MRKLFIVLGAVALFGGGAYVGSRFLGVEKPMMAAASPLAGMSGAASATGTIASTFTGEVIEVMDGQSIQEAVGRARPGDMVRVYPGTYRETVYIDKDNITLQGVIREGEWPTMEGDKKLNDAILYSGNGITVENFRITNYKGNGIMGQAGNNFVLRNNLIIDTGVYGIFPEYGTNGVISHNILSGIEDAAIYVGMCDNVDVRNNEVFNSVAGIEIENCRYSLVEDNYVHDNTGGILTFITPGLPIKDCHHVIIRNNFVVNNNHENFAIKGSLVASLPKGTGIIVMAADDVVIENNIVQGNNNAGIVVTDLSFGAQISKDLEVEPYPDRIVILDNVMLNNGAEPMGDIQVAIKAGLVDRGPDVVSNGKTNGCMRNAANYVTLQMGHFERCDHPGTSEIRSYLLAESVKPRTDDEMEKGKLAYYGVCAGCHAYDIRMIGPPTQVIQALYANNPQGIADYVANPVKKRDDFPAMPPQAHLTPETRLAVAKYLLSIEQQAKKGMGRANYNREAKEKKDSTEAKK